MQAHTVNREYTDRGYALKLVVGLLVLGAVSTLMVFRPSRPSSFTEHGAFGAGHGRQTMMFGAMPRKGAAP